MTTPEREIKELRDQISEMTDRLGKLTSDSAEDLMSRGTDYLRQARDMVGDKARAAGRQVHDYAKENPWQVATAAVLAGVAIGVLVSRRDRD